MKTLSRIKAKPRVVAKFRLKIHLGSQEKRKKNPVGLKSK